jgi:hypothetical protein
MSGVENRVRAALTAHAQTFTTRPDAWDQTRARAARTSAALIPAALNPAGLLWRWRLSRRGQLLIPAAAAAVVVAIVVAATVTVHGLSDAAASRPGSASRTGTTTRPTSDACSAGVAPPESVFSQIQPSSAILCLKLTEGTQRGYLFVQVGSDTPLNWLPWVATGLQYCSATSDTTTSTSGFVLNGCWQLPQLGRDQLASVTGAQEWSPLARLSLPMPLLSGFAVAQVTSVSAVLPDGRSYQGTVSGGHGFPEKAWAVLYPGVKGARLVFRDAAGRQVTSLAAPPGQVVSTYAAWRPHSGGTVYRCPDCDMSAVAYLIGGHVGYWVPGCGPDLLISPALPPSADGEPALAGITLLCDAGGGSWGITIGYARQDVTRVVLRLPDGTHITVPTFPARWPGSKLRLWVLIEPQATWNAHFNGQRAPSPTARAYDTSGPVGGEVELSYPDA